MTSTLVLLFNASKIKLTLHTACHNLWKSPATCAHSTQTCEINGGHYAMYLNNLTKHKLSQCYKFKLLSMSHPGAVCDKNKCTVVHHGHYVTVWIWTIRSHSDALCDRNKYTVVHHAHYVTVRLWQTVLPHSDTICDRNKYAVLQYITARLWQTFWHIQREQITKISTKGSLYPPSYRWITTDFCVRTMNYTWQKSVCSSTAYPLHYCQAVTNCSVLSKRYKRQKSEHYTHTNCSVILSEMVINDQRVRQTCERETHQVHGEHLVTYHSTQKPDEVSNHSDFTNSFRHTDKWLWCITIVCVHSRSHKSFVQLVQEANMWDVFWNNVLP